MGATTEVLKQDIEDTRSAMGGTLEAIGDRVSPGRIIERRRNRVVGWFSNAKDRVMGTADEVTSHVSSGAQQVANAPGSAVESVKSGTKGTPLVAGSIAFGVGVLVGMIAPTSRVEERLGEQARQAVEPITSELQGASREIVEHMREPLHEAVDTVKESARDSADQVRDAVS
jgi:hypothetical protein